MREERDAAGQRAAVCTPWQPPRVPPMTVPQACVAASVSRAALYREIQAGRLRILKVGRKTLITDQALREWQAACEVVRQPEAEAA